ncbi:MlaE family ABC transporter permease [Amaricoccus tamworthensis]|uniref:MlaE family ABC transporter permease n=1 Tax=Amaricoccus tamworthensis TaxID=57002 RepID=UPI003C7D56FC
MAEPQISIRGDGDMSTLVASGELTVVNMNRLEEMVADNVKGGFAAIDIGDVSKLDTAGAWLLTGLLQRSNNPEAGFENATDLQKSLLETVADNMPKPLPPQKRQEGFVNWLNMVGQGTSEAWSSMLEILSLLGEIIARIAGYALRPWRLRWTSLVHHMQAVGLNAIPIVLLMSFLIGVVLAFQGAVQLQQFGAEIFVVDLISISILRELGILLTAIIVAGRSGSAFTASIGSMKMREEIDAMRTLGLDPVSVLVVPRVLALVIMLPILGFLADMAGLIGGCLMVWINLGLSPTVFYGRLLDNTDAWQFLIGMIKAPFFAVLIALIGCHMGLRVKGNAESLGVMTSRSVVMGIFMVIIADALFSIFFALLGL